MERQIPKNVRQIGNVSDSPKIYVEDYVDTFFLQLCDKAKDGPIGAFLVGDMQKSEDEEYVYIYGAIQMHYLKLVGNEYVIDDETWKNAYEDCKQYFEDGEMLGWFVAQPGVELDAKSNIVKLHKKSFPKQNTVFVMKDSAEKEESYFVHKLNDLMEIGGRYTYYEKNPCMQNYMISSRKKNGASASETVEDRAAKDFRSLARKRSEHQKGRRPGSLMYAAGACVILILVIMGVSLFNSFDRMKSVQNTLVFLDKETVASDGKTSEETTDDGSVPTSAEIEAVKGQTDADSADENKTKEESVSGQKEDGKDEKNENPENSLSESNDKKEPEGSDSAQGADEQTIGSANGQDGVYIVEKGDTLAIISRKIYGDLDHVDTICKMNGITDGNLIYIGQKLLLP